MPTMAGDIKGIRLSLGFNQRQFGEALGLKNPQIQVSQLESGRRPVSERIAKAARLIEENAKLLKKINDMGKS